jgi:MoaA/NifB/PqqE/SkfB family radical SAM enzyme
MRELSILYRGPLSSCNYGCPYCPFAKHFESPAELEADKAALVRFAAWAEGVEGATLSVLFTPWGEALVRKWYQQAVVFLSRLPQVKKVAVQTNLSCGLEWMEGAEKSKLGIWATFHPGETAREKFVAKCRELSAMGVRFSAGVVGLKEHREEIEALRRELPAGTYVWINAYKREPGYYTPEVVEAFTAVDPLFPVNTKYHESAGKACRAGHTVVSVDGDGTVRRCHFIKGAIGNLYAPGFVEGLSAEASACTNARCGCHIGYVHMPHLGLYEVFGEGVLERVPAGQVSARGR